jgi:hypothetical protein
MRNHTFIILLVTLLLAFGLFVSANAQQPINITSLSLQHLNADTGIVSIESPQINVMPGYGDWVYPPALCFPCNVATEVSTSFDRRTNSLVLGGTMNNNGTPRQLRVVLKVLGESGNIKIPFISYPLGRPLKRMVSSSITGTIDIYDANTDAFLYTANVNLRGNAIITFSPIHILSGDGRRGVDYRSAVFTYRSSQ